ncbi:MAG TPA: tetratricopeptide repeat protein [Candidatus Sulfotelmatobacter sp.]|nr:tetratricopeptide repeat protein [Candidatus Sulfotelmatobacter sp.]
MTDSTAVDIQTKSGVKSGTAASGRGRRWLLLTSSAVVVPVLILVILEFSLRAAGVGYDTALLIPCTVRGVPSSCYNLFFAAPYFPAGMVQVPRLYSIPVVKPPKTYRIFVLGESAAMGDPDSAYGWSRYLEVMLRQQYPQMKFEVVNTGSVAINSHVVLRIADGLASQHPDLFIIYSGNNEVVGPYGPGTVLTSSAMSMPVVRASIFYHSSRIGQLLTKLGTQKKEWRGMEMFLDKQVPENSPLMKQVYSNYERNLRETILVAQKAGAAVIVATTATNLEDCAPFASLHRENLRPDQLHEWEALVKRGDQLKSARSDAEALKLYLRALTIDDQYAELEFRIAQCLRTLGDFKSARQHFVRARDLDTLRFRADSRINEINRSVPSSMHGVTTLDTEEVLSQSSADGIIGSDLIYEHVHLTPAASYLLAKAIFNEVAERLPANEVATAGVMAEGECERLLALTNFDRARLAQEMARRLQRPPFTNQLNHAEQLLRYEMQQQSTENPNDTALEYQWAIAQSPGDIMLHYHYGMFLFQYNRQAAAQQFAMAQPWDGFPVFMPDGTRVK